MLCGESGKERKKGVIIEHDQRLFILEYVFGCWRFDSQALTEQPNQSQVGACRNEDTEGRRASESRFYLKKSTHLVLVPLGLSSQSGQAIARAAAMFRHAARRVIASPASAALRAAGATTVSAPRGERYRVLMYRIRIKLCTHNLHSCPYEQWACPRLAFLSMSLSLYLALAILERTDARCILRGALKESSGFYTLCTIYCTCLYCLCCAHHAAVYFGNDTCYYTFQDLI